MLSSLPSLAPRDSHALWYTSIHRPSEAHPRPEQQSNDPSHSANIQNNQRRAHHNASHRSPLAKLRVDELYLERRKNNVSNFGSSWIKPPGVYKSLHQQREERREMEEHQETMRREQLALELAEAEAEGQMGDGTEEMEEARDLDADIPDADADVMGMDHDDIESDEESVDTDDEDLPRQVIAQRIPEDVYREAIARGEDTGSYFTGNADMDETDRSQMLQEEDLHQETSQIQGDIDMGMDMDADLDGSIPAASSVAGYEHTDTEDELSSSDDDESVDAGALPVGRTASTSMVRSDGTQHSLDLSAMDLRSSSMAGSSPATAWLRRGSARRRHQ